MNIKTSPLNKSPTIDALHSRSFPVTGTLVCYVTQITLSIESHTERVTIFFPRDSGEKRTGIKVKTYFTSPLLRLTAGFSR